MPLVIFERPGEEAAVRAVVADAFGDERTPALVDALRRSSAWRNLSFVAEEAGAIVGHVSFTRGWLDAPSKLIEVLILSPLSVAREYQGRGIGSALVLESLANLRSRPEPLVFLEGSPRYYGRLGFRPGGEAGVVAPSSRIPAAAFQFVTLPAYEPGMTGALVYPDAFWENDSVGLRP